MQEKNVCLVIGAGAGIGVNVAKRFAISGYHAVLSRRTNQEGLDLAIKKIEEEGGSATGFLINAIEENSIESLIEKVEQSIGSINVAVFNLGSQIGNRSLFETSEKVFERGWRMATLALFRTAKKAKSVAKMNAFSVPSPFSGLDSRILATPVLDSSVQAPPGLDSRSSASWLF